MGYWLENICSAIWAVNRTVNSRLRLFRRNKITEELNLWCSGGEKRYLSRSLAKQTKWRVRPVKPQNICPVWSESSLFAWRLRPKWPKICRRAVKHKNVYASCSQDGLSNPYTCIRWMTSQTGYLKLLITRSILSGPLDFEIKRVACTTNQIRLLLGKHERPVPLKTPLLNCP